MNNDFKLLKGIELRNFRAFEKVVSIDLYTRAPNKQEIYSIGDTESNQLKYSKNKWVNAVSGIMGVNASGKTSLLEGISFAYEALNGKLVEKTVSKARRYISRTRFEKRFQENEDLRDTGLMVNPISIANKLLNDVVEGFSSNGNEEKSTIKLLFTDRSWGEVVIGHFEDVNGDYSDVRIETNKIESPVSIRDSIINIVTLMLESKNSPARELNKIISDSVYMRGLNIYFHSNERNRVGFLPQKVKYANLFNRLREILTEEKFMNIMVKLDKNIETITENGVVVLKGGAKILGHKLSNGTKKMLWNIYHIMKLRKTGGIILIDEIENGLNLSLIKLLIKDIETDVDLDTQNPVQMIFTTHWNTIQDRKLIDANNTLFIQDGKISKINIIDGEKIDGIPWKDQRVSAFTNKNYWNDAYWLIKKAKAKSTLSDFEIDQLLELLDGQD